MFSSDHLSYEGTELRVEAGKTLQLELNCELPRQALGIGGIVLEPDGMPSSGRAWAGCREAASQKVA